MGTITTSTTEYLITDSDYLRTITGISSLCYEEMDNAIIESSNGLRAYKLINGDWLRFDDNYAAAFQMLDNPDLDDAIKVCDEVYLYNDANELKDLEWFKECASIVISELIEVQHKTY